MRKVNVSNLASVDGFFEGPNKELDWHIGDDEFFTCAKEMLRNAGTLIFGAVTYKMMGRGNPLFTGIRERIRLKLLATKVLGSGVVILSYQKA